MNRKVAMRVLALACGFGLAVVGGASAQGDLGLPSWNETTNGGGDAGIQNVAQVTTGNGVISTISGSLSQATGDHVDCYLITVTDPDLFYVTTDPAVDPLAVVGETDTRLFLFNATGTIGISAQDDTPDLCPTGDTPGLLSYLAEPNSLCVASAGNDPRTFVAAPVNPVTTTPLVAGTDYVLCYTYFPNDPDAAGGADMIPIGTNFEALNGPAPGNPPFVAWENGGTDATAGYTLALRGVGSSDVPVELMGFDVE